MSTLTVAHPYESKTPLGELLGAISRCIPAGTCSCGHSDAYECLFAIQRAYLRFTKIANGEETNGEETNGERILSISCGSDD
jgi:hypothetical protein